MNTQTSTYSLDTKNGVWQRAGHTVFAYSDGDEAENRIHAIVAAASDLSVLSTELRTHISDWPSNYHLSSQRANLLRPLKESLNGTVLEIGSGCGAITRFLGESASSVVALEGSHRRASITRARTRDLSNVEVFCDEFSAFETDKKFDAVTLIGVLEYANMFVGGPQPALDMLKKVKAHLADDGSLVIAIENQLGLKYFAGAPEDHLGKAMLGVEDQYLEGGVRTYGKKRLTSLLHQAGFEEIEFLYPFPDYKMPTSILSDEGLDHETFDSLPFLVSTAGKDPQLALEPSFSLERTWPVLASDGLAASFANSFLIVASPKKPAAIRNGRLAWHYSTHRKPEFCKETVFSKGQQTQSVAIERNRLAPLTNNRPAGANFQQFLDEADRYSASPLLSSTLVDLMTRPNWTYEQLGAFLHTFAAHVATIGQIPLVNDNVIAWEYPIPGSLYDCVPQNISVHGDGTVSAFDLEWHNSSSLPFTHLVFRGLWSVLGELTLIGQPGAPSRLSLLDVIQGGMAQAGKTLGTEEARALVREEIKFQATVSGATIDAEAVWSWLKEGNLRQLNSQAALSAAKQTMSALNAHIQHDADLIAQHKQHIATLDEKIRLMHSEFESTKAQVYTEAAQESLQSSIAIAHLTQLSARQHVHSKSLKNFVKRMRDYRNALRQSSASAGGSRRVAALASSLLNHWAPRPQLIACAFAADQGQATQLLKQSCHWPLPFAWSFSVRDTATSDAISQTGHLLKLDVRTSLRDPEVEISQPFVHLANNSGAFIAIPKFVVEQLGAPASAFPLPDAELIRQAYNAMHCDPTIAAAYAGMHRGSSSAQTQTPLHPLMCIFRSNDVTALPSEANFFKQHIASEQLQQEIEAMRKWASSVGKSVLIL